MHHNPIVLLDKINIFPCQNCTRAFLRRNDLDKHEAEFNHVNQDVLALKTLVLKHLPECDKHWEREITRIRDAEIHDKSITMKNKNLAKEIKCESWDIKLEQKKNIILHASKSKSDYNSNKGADRALKPEPIVNKNKETEDTEFKIKQEHDENFTQQKHTLSIISHNPVKQQVTEVKTNDKDGLVKNFDGIFTCGQCPKSYKTLKSMTIHLAEHVDLSNQNYQCSKCPKSFPTTLKLNKHVSCSHSIKHAVYCNVCRKECKNSTNLKIHLRTHTGERPFSCKQCGKSFTQTAALYTHMKIHLGLKEHNCQYCNKPFTEYHNMKRHERTHTKERPCDCKYCSKSFGDPSALIRHLRTHTGDKIYHCQMCPMKFSDASGLIAHKKRHDGNRDFACKLCPKKFFFRSDLLKHETSQHTNIKKYECDLCKNKFALKQYLNFHIQRQHN